MTTKSKIRFKFRSNNDNITRVSGLTDLFEANGRFFSFNGGDNIFQNLKPNIDVIQMGSDYFRFIGMGSDILNKETYQKLSDDNGVYVKVENPRYELDSDEYLIDFADGNEPLKIHRHNTEDLEDYSFDPEFSLQNFEDLKEEIIDELAEFEGIADPDFKAKEHFDELRINEKNSKVWITSVKWEQHHQYVIDNFGDLSRATQKQFFKEFAATAVATKDISR